MNEAESRLLNHAVNYILHHAIPTSEEFKLRDVLVYEKKLQPHAMAETQISFHW